jgi:hypothetical protein
MSMFHYRLLPIVKVIRVVMSDKYFWVLLQWRAYKLFRLDM